MNSAASGMLGILNRGGALAFGPSIEGAMKKAHLLLLASDASERTKKELTALANSHRVPIHAIASMQELGAPLGRPALSGVAVLSKNGAASLLQKLQKGEDK